MKKLLACAFMFPLCAMAITPAQQMFLEGRRIAIDRKIEDGKVITTWARNGKVESVVTNVLKDVVGVKINNPLEDRIVSLTNSLAVVQADLVKKQNELLAEIQKNERIVAKLTEQRAEYVEKRDTAKLPTTKAIYQLFIDVIDDILGIEN